MENLHDLFEIIYKETDECPIASHQHNFFELTYILDGVGEHVVNDNKFIYQRGHLFLLTPKNHHSFKVKETTKFFFVRFNNIYLKEKINNDLIPTKGWIQKLEYIFHNAVHLPGCILQNANDKPLVKALIESLIREYVNQKDYNFELVKQIITTLITIVARNLVFVYPEILNRNSVDAVSIDIINYIHNNIYSSENLKAEKIASKFNISQNYLSEYFKKHVGENLQHYITNYKLKLVETRLKFSDMRINEIAFELNFTDESHLNKIFKKYNGISPSQFRKELKEVSSL